MRANAVATWESSGLDDPDDERPLPLTATSPMGLSDGDSLTGFLRGMPGLAVELVADTAKAWVGLPVALWQLGCLLYEDPFQLALGLIRVSGRRIDPEVWELLGGRLASCQETVA